MERETTVAASLSGPRARPPSGGTSPARVALYLAVGAVLIYLSTWLGPLTFYMDFQRPLLEAPEESRRRMVWLRPLPVAPGDGAGWTLRDQEGERVPLPPGNLLRVTTEGDLVLAEFEEGTVQLELFPQGFLSGLYVRMVERAGGEPRAPPSDAAVLAELSGEYPGRYRFSWSAAERQVYAARILVKMLLWEDLPVRRAEIATSGGDSPRASVLAEYDTGVVKVIAARGNGVLVVVLPAGAPETWTESPGPWLREE